MNTDYTHITVILDRSGSMESIRDDTIGGFNTFLQQQKAEPGQATLTLVQFDTQDPYEVIHKFRPIAQIPPLTAETFVPRASTPLLDAMGRGINDLAKCIADLPEPGRPGKVVMAFVTDGQENSSHEFSKRDIEQMVKEKTEKAGWQFVFLSADLAATADATQLGIDPDAVLPFQKTGAHTAATFHSLSQRTSDYRKHNRDKLGFLHTDRQHPDDPANKKVNKP